MIGVSVFGWNQIRIKRRYFPIIFGNVSFFGLYLTFWVFNLRVSCYNVINLF